MIMSSKYKRDDDVDNDHNNDDDDEEFKCKLGIFLIQRQIFSTTFPFWEFYIF